MILDSTHHNHLIPIADVLSLQELFSGWRKLGLSARADTCWGWAGKEQLCRKMYEKHPQYCQVYLRCPHPQGPGNSVYSPPALAGLSSPPSPSCKKLNRSTKSSKRLVVSKDARWSRLCWSAARITILRATLGQKSRCSRLFWESPRSRRRRRHGIRHQGYLRRTRRSCDNSGRNLQLFPYWLCA